MTSRWGNFALQHFFQPIVDLRDRSVIGFEALLRCGDVPPQTMFSRAREQNLLEEVRLDLSSLRLAVDTAMSQGLSAGRALFLNLRPVSVRALAAGALRLKPPEGESPRLIFELSEEAGWPAAEQDWERIRLALGGVGQIALDDVGEGWSDLRRIQALRPQWVKVARSISTAACQDQRGFAVLFHLTSLAHELGSAVIAEGIETAAEWEVCRAAGVDYGQGYFFAHPGTGPLNGDLDTFVSGVQRERKRIPRAKGRGQGKGIQITGLRWLGKP